MADILVPNETEFAFLMQHLFDVELPDEYWTAADTALHAFCCRANVGVVILTLGEKGCFVSCNPNAPRARRERLPDKLYFRVPAAAVSPIDTTGAGDAFSGGLAAGLVRFDCDLRRAVEYANVIAGLATEKPGTAPAMPDRAAVDAFISAGA